MLNVSPRQLEVFVHAAASGSLSAAAGRLHLTQPAASMALAEMERLLGSRVFDRVPGGLRLNPRGRELLPLAQELLERHAEFTRAAGDGDRLLAGELRIGTSNTVGNYRVGELLGAFVAAQPEAVIRLQVANTETITQGVLEHALDIGCVEGPVIHPDIEVAPWRDDVLVVCAPPGHPLAGRRRLQAEAFQNARWVLREPGSATRSLAELVLAQLPPPLSRLELSQTEAIKQAVAAGLGIAVLPQVAVAEAVAAGRLEVLKTPFLQPFLRRKLSLLLHRRRYRGALLEAFLASL